MTMGPFRPIVEVSYRNKMYLRRSATTVNRFCHPAAFDDFEVFFRNFCSLLGFAHVFFLRTRGLFLHISHSPLFCHCYNGFMFRVP